MRIKRRKKIRKTEFEKLFVEKHRKLFILRKKNRTERKKIKSPAVNSGLAPLRVLRIFGKFRAKPKFVYICEVPCANATTAGQAGGTLNAIYFPNLRWKLRSYLFVWYFKKTYRYFLRDKWNLNRTLPNNFVLKIRCGKPNFARQIKFAWQ